MNLKKQAVQPNDSHAQEQEERLAFALQAAFPAAEVSPQLQSRISEMALSHAARQQRRRVVRLRLRAGMGLAFASLLLVVFIGLWPRIALARVLARVDAAMSGVQNAHIVTWRLYEDGRRSKQSESWYQNGKHRLEEWPSEHVKEHHTIEITRDGKLWSYQPEFGKVTIVKWLRSNKVSDLTGSGLIAGFKRSTTWNNAVNVAISKDNRDGRPVRRIVINAESRQEEFDLTILVDAATDLPIEGQTEVRSQNGLKIRNLMTFDFNRKMAASLFEPKYPASTRIVDVDEGREEWRKKLAHGIARRKVGQRTIVIRDFQVNADGHVFMLYTAGRKFYGDKYPEFDKQGWSDRIDWDVQLTDELGTEYIYSTGRFQPTVESLGKSDNSQSNNLIFNGEKLEGQWWIPREPQSRPWKPRRFNTTFLINSHVWRPVKIGVGFENPPRVSSTFTFPVKKTATADVPDYMPYIAGWPREAKDIREAEIEVRRNLPANAKPSQRLIHTLLPDQGKRDFVTSLAFSPDSRVLASAVHNAGIKLWDVRSGKLRRTLTRQTASITSLLFSADGANLVSAGMLNNGKKPSTSVLQKWDAHTGKLLWKRVLANDESVLALRFSRDGKMLTSAATFVTERRMEKGREIVTKMKCRFRRLDARTGQSLSETIIQHQANITGVVLTIDGNATTRTTHYGKGTMGSDDVRLWDGRTGKLLRRFEIPERLTLGSLAISADGKLLGAFGGLLAPNGNIDIMRDGALQVWNVATGEVLQTVRNEPFTNALALSSDGKTLAASGNMPQQPTVKFWKARSRKAGRTLLGHSQLATRLEFSPDGKILASGDLGGEVKLWGVP